MPGRPTEPMLRPLMKEAIYIYIYIIRALLQRRSSRAVPELSRSKWVLPSPTRARIMYTSLDVHPLKCEMRQQRIPTEASQAIHPKPFNPQIPRPTALHRRSQFRKNYETITWKAVRAYKVQSLGNRLEIYLSALSA